MSNPDKPDFVVVAIGARGKLSSRDAKDAVKLWRQLQREAPQASFRRRWEDSISANTICK